MMAKHKLVHRAQAPTPASHAAHPPHLSAGLLRRLGAWLYDSLVVCSLLIIAGFIGYGVANLLLTMGIAQVPADQDALWLLTEHHWSLIYTLWLAWVIIGFYCWFWTRAGQTVGMRAWRLRVENYDGSNIKLTQALIRLATSAFGLGNLMCLFNRKKPRAFQDIWAECQVVVLTKEENLAQLSQ